MSYADDKHLSTVSLVLHSNQGFEWTLWKAYVMNAPPEAGYRWEMIEISLQTVEI